MKLIHTITVTTEVNSLDDFRTEDGSPVTDIKEAAALEQSWVDEGIIDPYDLLGSDNVVITVTGVE